MTSTSVPAARLRAAIHATEGFPSLDATSAEDTITAFEEAVTETLAERIGCTYGDASGIVDLHTDIVEAGFEERSSAAEIAREIDAQSRVGGGS